jgi:hypothetical protein
MKECCPGLDVRSMKEYNEVLSDKEILRTSQPGSVESNPSKAVRLGAVVASPKRGAAVFDVPSTPIVIDLPSDDKNGDGP